MESAERKVSFRTKKLVMFEQRGSQCYAMFNHDNLRFVFPIGDRPSWIDPKIATVELYLCLELTCLKELSSVSSTHPNGI